MCIQSAHPLFFSHTYYQYSPSIFCYAEPMVNPFVNDPHNIFTATHHALLFFLIKRVFLVRQIIADLLFPLHTQRNELIPCLPSPDVQWKDDFVCIQASHMSIFRYLCHFTEFSFLDLKFRKHKSGVTPMRNQFASVAQDFPFISQETFA